MSRRLTIGERKLLYPVFLNTVNYDAVRLVKGGILTTFNYAVTINNTIYFPRASFDDDFSFKADHHRLMPWLCHEIGHVWQFQNLNYTWRKAMWEQIRYRTHVYEYQIEKGKRFIDYRYEQQCEIFKDYYKAKFLHLPTLSILEPLIIQARRL